MNEPTSDHTCKTDRCSDPDNIGQSCECPKETASNDTAVPEPSAAPKSAAPKPSGGPHNVPTVQVCSHCSSLFSRTKLTFSQGFGCYQGLCYGPNSETEPPPRCQDSRCLGAKPGAPCGCAFGIPVFNPLPTGSVHSKTTSICAGPKPTATHTAATGAPYGNHTSAYIVGPTGTGHGSGTAVSTQSHSRKPRPTATGSRDPFAFSSKAHNSTMPSGITEVPHMPIPTNTSVVASESYSPNWHYTERPYTETFSNPTGTAIILSQDREPINSVSRTHAVPVRTSTASCDWHERNGRCGDHDAPMEMTAMPKRTSAPCANPVVNPDPPHDFICPGDGDESASKKTASYSGVPVACLADGRCCIGPIMTPSGLRCPDE